MKLEMAREISNRLRCYSKEHLNTVGEAAVCLDNQITELEAEMKQVLGEFDEVEAQRDELLDVCRGILNGLENVQIDILRAEIAKYDKDLPKFKDIIGLHAEEKQSGVAG